MAAKVVLHLTPFAGTRFAKAFPPGKMNGLDYVPMAVLGTEPIDSIEQQVRECFPKSKTAANGSLTASIKLVGVVDPAKKPLSTILDLGRRDDPDLEELDRETRSLTVYVDFKTQPAAKGEKPISMAWPSSRWPSS